MKYYYWSKIYMNSIRTYKTIFTTLLFGCLILFSEVLFAQHRGDNLSFQGLTYKDNLSTKANAMGGAMTAVSGDLSSLFYNSAGLSRINGFQISVEAEQYSRQWRENQNWFPDRQFTNLPFYLEGLYVPDPKNNGRYDYELYKDSTGYLINPPALGKDPYSENVAQWKHLKSGAGISNIKVAFPFVVMDRKFVAAAGYLRNNINDFDKNDTYLSPTLTSYDYENIHTFVNGIDTLVVNWSRFTRQRTGYMNNFAAALSHEVFENIMVGVGMKVQSGNSDDYLSLIRFGDLHLMDAQKFKFYFVDSSQVISGTSKYSSTSFNLGLMMQFSILKMGLKIELPYTLTRERNYIQLTTGAVSVSQTLGGKDKVKIPAIYNFGLSFQPVDEFLIAFNYEYAPYSKAIFSFATPDQTFRQWSDQNTLAVGIEYKMYEFLSLMAGYRTIPEVFIPDGAAIKDKGPSANSYNFGVSVTTFVGRIDLAYQYRRLKYYDSYYSNTNYVFEANSSFMVGINYSL
jgi:opacity protein-like surface antigen